METSFFLRAEKYETNFIKNNYSFLSPKPFIQILCFILMIICNAMVWTFFVKAMHEDGGTLVATVTSAATNYCCSVGVPL